MSVGRMWFHVEWRTRWRGLVGLLLLIAFMWRAVANDTPVEFAVPEDWSMIAVTAGAVLALFALLAVWPSRRLASLQLTRELRTE